MFADGSREVKELIQTGSYDENTHGKTSSGRDSDDIKEG
jgi:hypothetical protein